MKLLMMSKMIKTAWSAGKRAGRYPEYYHQWPMGLPCNEFLLSIHNAGVSAGQRERAKEANS